MSKKSEQTITSLLLRIGAVVVGLALMAVFLSPTVKGWLNRIPNFWRVFYPLLTLFAGYLLVSAIFAGDGVVAAVKWLILVLAALSATAFVYGAPRIFFTIGRTGAIVFIVVEVLHTLLEGVLGESETETA
ncbi:MAG: hypothetical protein ACP5JG_09935 [Anaerolineae bacterium]